MQKFENTDILLVYTMTSGLGDYFVLGDLATKIERLAPRAKCLFVHRANPHVKLWPYDDYRKRFFNILSIRELLSFVKLLHSARKRKTLVFALQIATGSLQGYLFYRCLKKLRCVDYIVDFNLINADIITRPQGEYILDLHLNQIKELLKLDIPPEDHKLHLPLILNKGVSVKSDMHTFTVGIHPWSRRGHLTNFVWPFDKWLQFIQTLLSDNSIKLVIFGKDNRFEEFHKYILQNVVQYEDRIEFIKSNTVSELVDTVSQVDLIISVNTAIVHIGYALNKKMVILVGPSLGIWTPRSKNILVEEDQCALFHGSDKDFSDIRFPSVNRIAVVDVLAKVKSFY